KVSPSNQQYVEALQQFVAAEPTLRSGTGILFYDNKPDDIYNQTLRAAFEKWFPTYIQDRKWEFPGSRGTNGEATTDFSAGRSRVCAHNADMIFLAGRSRELPKLIDNLAARKSVCGHNKRIVILSGTTGLGGLEKDTARQALMREKNIIIVDASSANLPQWRTGTAPAG